MSVILIKSEPDFIRELESTEETVLEVSEFFADTIQGEGINAGIPAFFLRLQDCTLNCVYCDTESVWRYGNPYTINEILDLFDQDDWLTKLSTKSTHLVFTGGSPLRQQFQIEELLKEFHTKFGFIPYIEIENECTLMPSNFMKEHINCWNNSPKLEASNNSKSSRYKPNTLKALSALPNSWFKFVVTKPQDWEEIKNEFLLPGLIKRNQIILMPEGETRERLALTRELTIDLAVKYGVRYSDRLHIVAWNKRTGV